MIKFNEYVKSLFEEPENIDNVGSLLLGIEWNFKAVREGKGLDLGLLSLAEAFKDTMDAAAAIGWVEHTSDWDPYLIIKMADGRVLHTPSHYYQVIAVQEVSTGEYYLLVEAPFEETPPEDYEEAINIHEYYYLGEDGDSVYRIPLMEIDYITVDPQ